MNLFYFILILLYPSISFAAIAAEPYSEVDLKKYGAHADFDATVLLNSDCSASKVDFDNIPFDVYITAAHCFEEEEEDELLEFIFKDFVTELMDPLDIKIINFYNFKERYFNLTSEYGCTDLEETEELLETLYEDLDAMIITLSQLYQKGFIMDFPESIEEYEKIIRKTFIPVGKFDQFEISKENYYVIHPKYCEDGVDLAVFTTFKKTKGPAYKLFRGDKSTLLNAKVISVGFGQSNEQGLIRRRIYRQAFDAITTLHADETIEISSIFMPQLYNRTFSLKNGLLTDGDDGGSLLIQDSDGFYYLCGVNQVNTCGTTDPIASFSEITYNFKEERKKTLEEIYHAIPSELKNNTINQNCSKNIDSGFCYGSVNVWTTLDIEFIDEAVEELLFRAYERKSKTEF